MTDIVTKSVASAVGTPLSCAMFAGSTYDPGMMTFDGSTGYYQKTGVTFSGNKAFAVVRFNRADFTGDVSEKLIEVKGGTYVRLQLVLVSSDHSTFANRRGKAQVDVQNSAGTLICKLISSSTFLDANDHVACIGFDGDTGAYAFYIDGVNEDDSANPDRVTPTTGALDSTAGTVTVGGDAAGGWLYGGKAGYVGYRDAYLTNPTDFYNPFTGLQELDETTWTEWGAQPLFWNKFGQMTDNKGSAGNMTANGTITGPS